MTPEAAVLDTKATFVALPLRDGEIVFAAAEERYTREKHCIDFDAEDQIVEVEAAEGREIYRREKLRMKEEPGE